ncbi:MAG TPA: hypothetical protein VNW93_00775 [Mycobacterium sp.]|nr:hypothetical protein [Mycobacterium sp.]
MTPFHQKWPRTGLGGGVEPKLTPALAPGYHGGEFWPENHGGQPGGGKPGGGQNGNGGALPSSHGPHTQLVPSHTQPLLCGDG